MANFQFTVSVNAPKKVNGLPVTKDWVADVLENIIQSGLAKATDEVESDPSDGARLRSKMEVRIERGNQEP